VTSQKAQIQALINGIDEVLTKNTPRLPWVMSNDAMQQRQVLEQTRQYLTSLQQQIGEEALPAGMAGSLTASVSPLIAASQASAESPAESAQQVLQAVLQEMNYWRVNMLQPLRTEVDTLQRQREILTQEIRQLEIQRQQQGGSQTGLSAQNQQLMEFLQAAMGQMQANLSGQVTQMIAAQSTPSLQAADRANLALNPAERLAQVQQMQLQSDHLMLKLDSTLQVIFESLNRNVQTYQESLEQGLDRMQSLGQQGEAMFAFLVNRLAQQLGREASTFLQSGDTPGLPTSEAASSNGVSSSEDFKVADFLSQTSTPPGSAPSTGATSFVPAMPFNISEEVLDISALEALGDSASDLEMQPDLNSDLNSELSQELSQLDLNMSLEAAEPYDLFSGDQPLVNSTTAETAPSSAHASSSDLDSALDLLNQLSAEMQAEANFGQQTANGDQMATAPYPASDSISDLATDLGSDLASEPELITAPDSLYDRSFYNNLFQDPASSSDAKSADANSLDANSLDDMALQEEWFGGLGDPAQTAAQTAVSPTDTEPERSSGNGPVNNNANGNLVSQPFEALLLDNSTPAPSTAITEETFSEDTLTGLANDLANDLDANSGNNFTNRSASPEAELPVVESGNNLDLGMTVDALADLGNPGNSVGGDQEQSAANRNESHGSKIDSGAVTLEGLENLFADLPDVVDPSDEEKKNL
jgi:hypothetical protein